MGLFSSTKKTYVASITYPLGEDDDGRVDYLKYTVLNATIQHRDVGEAISQGYLRGQGIALKSAFRYARDFYADGVPKSESVFVASPDTIAIAAVISSLNQNADIEFVLTMVGTADYVWWAERYLAQNFGYDRVLERFMQPPTGVLENATVAYDLEPNGLIRILLQNPGGGTATVIDYRPEGLKAMGNYVHAAFRTVRTFNEGDVTTTRPANPDEVSNTSSSTATVDRVGETQTTTTTIAVTVSAGTATVVTSKRVVVKSRPKYFIYEIGSGTHPDLDSLIGIEDLTAPYYPSVPLRVNNKDVTTDEYQEKPLYKTSKKLLRKVGVDIDEVVKQVNTNPSRADIDFAFVAFGVRLKTESQEGKRYIHRYLQHLRTISPVTLDQYNAWQTDFNGRLVGSPVKAPPMNVVQIYSEKDRATNHDIKLQWNFIDTQLKSGTIAPDAKIGDVALSAPGANTVHALGVDIVLDVSLFVSKRQVTVDTYEEITIGGWVHENYIYKGKAVTTTAYEGFKDENEDGFLVPLHAGIIAATPMRELTDLSYQCMHMVFNCYQIVKQKWYTKTWFKVVIVIIAILIIVFTWGTGTPVAAQMIAGVLIGLGIPLSAAIFLAATIYVLGMMILMNILTKVTTKLFGEEWGAVIAAVVAFVAMNYADIAAAVSNGFSTIISAQSLLQATVFVANAYGAYTQGQMSKVQKEALGLQTEYDKQMQEIEDLTKQNLGTNLDMIDIQGYTQASWLNIYENLDTFLSRTLLTGSDICAITAGLIDNFTEVGLRLPNT